jgi:hypothetical protein
MAKTPSKKAPAKAPADAEPEVSDAEAEVSDAESTSSSNDESSSAASPEPKSSKEPTPKQSSYLGPVVIIVGVAIAAAAVFLGVQNKVAKGPSGMSESLAGAVPQPRVSSAPMEAMPAVPHTLHVHPNGFLNVTKTVSTGSYEHLDDLMASLCPGISNVDTALCAPRSGVRLYKSNGLRVWSLAETVPEDDVHCVPQGNLFVWPSRAVGEEFYPASVASPVKGKRIVLKQLSNKPSVISVSNFMTAEEMKEVRVCVCVCALQSGVVVSVL